MTSNDGDGRKERPRRTGTRPDRPPRALIVGGFLLLLVLLLAFAPGEGGGARAAFGRPVLELMEFERVLRRNGVEEVRFHDLQAQVKLRAGALASDEPERLAYAVNFNSLEEVKAEIDLIRDLSQEDRDARIETKVFSEPTNPLVAQLLVWFLPSLLLVGLLYFVLFRQMRGPGSPGSLLSFGKSRHRLASDKARVTLKDVAGIDEARAEVEEIVAFLRDPGKFSRLGGRIPKGVLLVGSPGTGKTLLAKATAGEAGVPFYSVSGSDFVEMFVGVGASRVRDLFAKAKENSPCIVFLDEIDAVGRRRGSGMGGGHDEREQTLNQILVEMDGFDTERGIIVMAATNRADILDPALLRPGRFDRQITVSMPDVDGREKILKVHAREKKLALEVNLRALARATPTFSGAELEALMNEAALAAAMADRDAIAMHDLDEARDKIRWGRQRKSQKLLEHEIRATAYHEAGHALVAALVGGCDPLHKVTIVPRGQALGLTMAFPENDRYSLSRTQILSRIAMAFGGRIGEQMFTGDLSTGASNDIEQATELARRMVTEWGMSDALGNLKWDTSEEAAYAGREERRRAHSEETLRLVDQEVRRICEDQYALAEQLITRNKEGLERIVAALLRYETITGEEVRALLDGRAITRGPEEAAPGAAEAPLVVHSPVAGLMELETAREVDRGPPPAGA